MPKNRFYNSLRGSLKHAAGHGERQTGRDSTSKFFQYGWRCTTHENDYSNKTLMGNWNEERYDIQKIVQPKPLPSQYSHCFETTYSSDYNKEKHQRTRRFEREPHWFPGHQPELEPPSFKSTAQSCYTIDYRPPYGTNLFALVQNAEQEQEGYNRCGENLQTMPSE
ncbi:UPF0686 protein C11orf1 homolog [Oxyura jamaicensis]|uniref:UPF0686 protein C11orf1 homolog n=1 Tax=Oxyura jamaicensis TaxID=8884 RepID=UPI0015A58E6F|nr:UPF0686 protein C11orf1 homolog [Oxyura jamaicensis]